jgi:hypothetical protein
LVYTIEPSGIDLYVDDVLDAEFLIKSGEKNIALFVYYHPFYFEKLADGPYTEAPSSIQILDHSTEYSINDILKILKEKGEEELQDYAFDYYAKNKTQIEMFP